MFKETCYLNLMTPQLIFQPKYWFSKYKPMGLYSGGLIIGVKNKLRNWWAYFLGGGLILGFLR